MKIHIFGASGSGTTTLGKALAQKLNYQHLDADDYYWVKTNPPFQEKVPKIARNARIKQDFWAKENSIISGSMVSWGKEWEKAFDLAVFLYLPTALRMQRLKQREKERYGKQLQTNPIFLAQSNAFLEWANKYDEATFPGRSLTIHEAFMERLTCPVIRIEGATPLEESVEQVLKVLEN